MTQSARRINLLAAKLGAQRYLEIGVNQGDTFRKIEIRDRTAVDPKFAFVVEDFAAPFTRFEETTSDLFFESEPFEPRYDTIFIDGLHHFEQVVRDISNSILRMHRRSIMLIDDTIPTDVYGAERDPAIWVKFRGPDSIDTSWHGDVFKILFFVHDFWPGLNYRTIVGAGNPQTLVWQSQSSPRHPIFDNLERISRLTYFDLLENLSIARCVSEDEAIDLCTTEIASHP